MRYVSRLLTDMIDRGVEVAEVRQEVSDAYVDAAHDHMVWTHRGMTNWYRNTNGHVVNMRFPRWLGDQLPPEPW